MISYRTENATEVFRAAVKGRFPDLSLDAVLSREEFAGTASLHLVDRRRDLVAAEIDFEPDAYLFQSPVTMVRDLLVEVLKLLDFYRLVVNIWEGRLAVVWS